jgi:hypothetical protein
VKVSAALSESRPPPVARRLFGVLVQLDKSRQRGCDRIFVRQNTNSFRNVDDRRKLKSIALSRGTESSNPSPSSGESVSHTDQAAAGREPRLSRGCAPLGWRRGRQRRAGRSNIAPKNSNFSVGPYSSTAVPPARFGDSDDTGPQQAGCLGTCRCRLGVEPGSSGQWTKLYVDWRWRIN